MYGVLIVFRLLRGPGEYPRGDELPQILRIGDVCLISGEGDDAF